MQLLTRECVQWPLGPRSTVRIESEIGAAERFGRILGDLFGAVARAEDRHLEAGGEVDAAQGCVDHQPPDDSRAGLVILARWRLIVGDAEVDGNRDAPKARAQVRGRHSALLLPEQAFAVVLASAVALGAVER